MRFISRLERGKGLIGFLVLLTVCATLAGPVSAATVFQYKILSVTKTAPGERPVIAFSVTNPANGNQPYDIKTDPAFTQTANGTSRLFIQIGWDTRDYNNTGSGSEFAPVGAGAALPIGINALSASAPLGGGVYQVTSSKPIPSGAKGSGVAAMEGHPAGIDSNGNYTVRVPVKSVYRYFPITDSTAANRRQVVDVQKCKGCHGTLSTHGNNRTDEPLVCVVCHNPNATDIPYRRLGDGPEVPIDFKWMVHAIHAAEERKTPLVIIGRDHSINDFSHVVFPKSLRNCLNCHLDKTFELPLGANVLGTTISTGSVLDAAGKVVNGDPADDMNITPVAAVCSACHDKAEDKAHMVRNGASFSALQQWIDSGAVKEKCVNCHGPGKEKDIRKMHLGDDD